MEEQLCKKRNILDKLTEIYIFTIIIIFPLIVDSTGFFKILECKYRPFNIYQDGIGTHNVSFMATIGNIDFISAMYCILLTVSFISSLDFSVYHPRI